MIIQIEPWIDQSELDELKRAIDSTFVVEHNLTAEFEERIRQLTGARHAIAMANGTVALFCCLKALGIGPGDEVIVPDLTFIATATSVIMAGATPVFCDVDPQSHCISIESARKVLSDKTKAIMPVHLYGVAADMTDVLGFAAEADIRVIEDAAQGVGVTFNGQHTGTFGDLGILSFYGNKTITCGEGGVVLTHDDELAKACYRLKNHGRDEKGTFIHKHLGFNFAFTDIQAAIGISQLKKLDRIIAKKKHIHDVYQSELGGLSAIQWPVVDERTSPVYWFTSVLVEDAEGLQRYLASQNIQSRRYFYPLHRQPCFEELKLADNRIFPNTESAYARGLSLPSSYGLSEQDQMMVVQEVKRYFERA